MNERTSKKPGIADYVAARRKHKDCFLDEIDRLIDWKPLKKMLRNKLKRVANAVGNPAYPEVGRFHQNRRGNCLAHPEKARSLLSTERLGPRPQGTGEIGANAVHPPLAGGSWPEAQGEPGAEQRRGPKRPWVGWFSSIVSANSATAAMRTNATGQAG